MVDISIKAARERKGLTQAELAKMLGVHQTNVVAWERGKWMPVARRLVELSKILECSADELLDVDGGETTNERT